MVILEIKGGSITTYADNSGISDNCDPYRALGLGFDGLIFSSLYNSEPHDITENNYTETA